MKHSDNVETDLLQLVVVDDILVSRTTLCESIQLVHVIHVTPQILHLRRNLKLTEVFA